MSEHEPNDFQNRRGVLLDDVYGRVSRYRRRRLIGGALPAALLVSIAVVVFGRGTGTESVDVAAQGQVERGPVGSGPSLPDGALGEPAATTAPPPTNSPATVSTWLAPPSSGTVVSAPSTSAVATATTTTTPRQPPLAASSTVPTTDSVEAGIWRLQARSADGRTLTIAVLPGACATFDHAEVVETIDRVEITAVVRRAQAVPPAVIACGDALGIRTVQVALQHPLGDRQLEGQCDPSEDSARGRQCRLLL